MKGSCSTLWETIYEEVRHTQEGCMLTTDILCRSRNNLVVSARTLVFVSSSQLRCRCSLIPCHSQCLSRSTLIAMFKWRLEYQQGFLYRTEKSAGTTYQIACKNMLAFLAILPISCRECRRLSFGTPIAKLLCCMSHSMLVGFDLLLGRRGLSVAIYYNSKPL